MPYPPPPDKFVPVENVRWVEFVDHQPPFIRQQRHTGAQARGVVYERKAQEYLSELVCQHDHPAGDGPWYKRSPWLMFVDGKTKRWCQPDGLIVDEERRRLTVVEIKYQHTADAWWQLWRLYVPIVQWLLPNYTILALELVKWHDPKTIFPARYKMTRSPLLVSDPDITAVHIWNPQRT